LSGGISGESLIEKDAIASQNAEPRSRGLGWMDSSIVVEEHTKPAIARGASEGHWILDLCAQLPVPREGPWLSLGCGTGAQEMLVMERGLADRIDAFDRAPESIEAAKKTCDERGFQGLQFSVDDIAAIELVEDEYDVVITSFELHRAADLEATLRKISAALKPGGWLLANEYIGPKRFQFSDRQLQVVEDLLSITPQHLRFDYVSHQRKDMFVPRPEAFWVEEAPLEAVSSELIVPSIERLFAEVDVRPYGGTILNPYLEHIVGNFDPASEADMTIVRLVMYVERLMLREGYLSSDFGVLSAQKPQ